MFFLFSTLQKSIKNCLQNYCQFNNVRMKLLEKGIIAIQEANYFLEKFNNDKPNAISELLLVLKSLFLENITNILSNVDYQPFDNISSALSDSTHVWKILIKDTKNLRLQDTFAIPALPFDNAEKILLSQIITSVKVLELKSENILEKKYVDTVIEYCNFYKLFDKPFNKMLVQGEPGIGKTVHFKYLINTWANNLWQFDDEILIIFLILGDVQPENDLYEEIKIQNFKSIDFITVDIIKAMIESKFKKIILFLDGADEFNQSNKLINKYITNPACNIKTVIWSRNWKGNEIKSTCDAIFELIGLNDVNIGIFFDKCFLDKQLSKKFIDNVVFKNERIKKMCTVHLLAMMLFHIWKENKNKFDKNMYEIYESIVYMVIYKNSVYTENKNKILKRIINSFGKVCLKNLSRSQLEIDVSIDRQLKYLKGLMQIIQGKVKGKSEIKLYHLSFQEYFAAKYLSKLLRKRRRKKVIDILDRLFVPSNISIFNVILFLKLENGKSIQKFCKFSGRWKKKFLCSDKIWNMLSRGSTYSELHLEHEHLQDFIVENIIEKNCNELEYLSLKYCTFDHKLLILNRFEVIDRKITENFIINLTNDIINNKVLKYLQKVLIKNTNNHLYIQI